VIKIFAGKVWYCPVIHYLSHPVLVHLTKAPVGQAPQFRIPSLHDYPFGALGSQRNHFEPHCSFGYSYQFETPSMGNFLSGPFLCSSPLCLWGRFGVPFKGSAGHTGFWLRVSGLCFGLGITVVLVVIFGCIFFRLILFFGAFSRYPFQSFVPNPGTKGFSLLSGLGSATDPICPWRM